MDLIPIYDATAPVACTADSSEFPVRLEQIDRLVAFGPTVERSPHGLLLHFPDRPEVGAEVEDFTVAEKGCCNFWGFDVSTADGRTTLRWDGPPEVAELLDQLAGVFEGAVPVSRLEGLF